MVAPEWAPRAVVAAAGRIVLPLGQVGDIVDKIGGPDQGELAHMVSRPSASHQASGSPNFSAMAILFAILLVASGLVGTAWAKKPTAPEDLFNPFLGVDYSYWLVGPIAMMASEEEINSYLVLQNDEAAKAFIEAFWQKRNQGTEPFKKTPRQTFEQRAAEADRRFTERTYPGSRTDRGAIFIVYGEPEKIVFESPQTTRGYTLEVWQYPKKPQKGLDLEEPKRLYKFVEIEGRTVFFRNQTKRPDPRDQIRRP